MKRRLISAVLALSLLLTLCSGAAMAEEIDWFAQMHAIQTARQVLAERYGITMETVGLLQATAVEENFGWLVNFRTWRYVPDAVGQYDVIVLNQGAPTVTWTHDGVDKSVWASGSLDAPVWGQPQLQKIMALETAYDRNMLQWWKPDADLTPEKWVEIEAPLLQLAAYDTNRYIFHMLPDAKDLTPEQAKAKANKALRAKYGLTDAQLAEYAVRVQFFMETNGNKRRYYSVNYTRQPDPANPARTIELSVEVNSPRGVIFSCYWNSDAADRMLPEGPLTPYRDAVNEYFDSGAFLLRTPAEKADIAKRMRSAGLSKALGGLQYSAPKPGDLSEADAQAKADAALLEVYGVNAEGLSLFERYASIQKVGSGRCWMFDYEPIIKRHSTWYWSIDSSTLGDYRIAVDAVNGELRLTSWSIWGANGDRTYTEKTWGQAAAVEGKLLPYVARMLDKMAALLAKYPTDGSASISPEDNGAIDQLRREAGFDPQVWYRGVPGPGDISLETAKRAACEALAEQYKIPGVRPEAVRDSEFDPRDPKQPIWRLRAVLDDDGRQDSFWIAIDAHTGKVLAIEYLSGIGGNG